MYIGFKKFIVLCLLLGSISAYAFSVPDNAGGYVNDYAKMLTPSEVAMLEKKLSDYEKNTTNEIAVVTIQSLDGDTIENVAQEIFTKWGIGKVEKNNGVLLLVSLTDRKARVHTGYGVEGDLTDIGTSYIQQEVLVPAFKDGKYFLGIDGSVDKIISALGGANIVPEDYQNKSPSSQIPWHVVFIIGFIILQALASILARSKSWWGGGVLGGVAGLGIWHFFINSTIIAIPLILLFIGGGLFFDFLVSRAFKQKSISGVYPWWFGGGGSGGGGGFGGFGGGGSGGGGSSSSW